MRVLAIDPGFERMGIAVIEKVRGEKETLLFSSCFKTPATLSFAERLVQIGGEMQRVIKTYEPQVLAVETLLFSKNQKTALLVAEAKGVIVYEARANGLQVHEYNPMQIKTAITGYGKATKKDVEFMVTRLVHIEHKVAHDDEMDAIAIGLTCLAIERFG